MSSQYTWHMPPNPNRFEFQRAVEDCQRVCEGLSTLENSVELGGWDGDKEPLFTPVIICFNGKGPDQSHQTFQVRLDGNGPNSCNTFSLRYDLAVRCCLLILQKHLKGFTYSGGPASPSWELSRAMNEKFLR